MTKAFFETVVIFSSILGPVHVDTANADELATNRQNFYTNCKGKWGNHHQPTFRLRYSRVFTQNLFIFEIGTPVASRLGPVHAELMQLS